MPKPVIVVKGGCLSGKSTVLQAAAQEFGDKLCIIPEAATILLDHPEGFGLPLPGRDIPRTDEWLIDFQRLVFNLQIFNENYYKASARGQKARAFATDRGLWDGAGYIPGGTPALEKLMGMKREEAFARYTHVLHLESIATAHPHLYEELRGKGNNCRYETLEEAQEVERRSREAWEGHPGLRLISGENGIASVVSEVLGFFHEILDTEIELKFLLSEIPSAVLTPGYCIEQGYLARSAEGVMRVRHEHRGEGVYTRTIKVGQGISRKEIETPISALEFAIMWPSTEGRRVSKTRHVLPYKGKRIEIDIYSGHLHGLVTAEVEFDSLEDARQFEFPDLGVKATDITEDSNFSNRSLAENGIPGLPKR